jgi:hypothetical protein
MMGGRFRGGPSIVENVEGKDLGGSMGKTTNQLPITDLITSTNMLGKVGPLGVRRLARLRHIFNLLKES